MLKEPVNPLDAFGELPKYIPPPSGKKKKKDAIEFVRKPYFWEKDIAEDEKEEAEFGLSSEEEYEALKRRKLMSKIHEGTTHTEALKKLRKPIVRAPVVNNCKLIKLRSVMYNIWCMKCGWRHIGDRKEAVKHRCNPTALVEVSDMSKLIHERFTISKLQGRFHVRCNRCKWKMSGCISLARAILASSFHTEKECAECAERPDLCGKEENEE
jgi:hypothetical protein